MEKNKTTSVLITAFIVVIMAVAFLSSIADQTNNSIAKSKGSDSYNLSSNGCYQGGQVNGTTDVNCNVTVTNVPTSWRVDDCPISSVVVSNSAGTALTLDTDYKLFASAGLVQFLNTTATNSTNLGDVATVQYSYCGSNYVNSGWGRSILGTNAGIYALAILIIAIGVAYALLGKKDDD